MTEVCLVAELGTWRPEGSLQLCPNYKLLRGIVVRNVQHVGLAADLAVFNVGLSQTGGFVDRGDVPLAAGGTLKTSFHGSRKLTSDAEAAS